MKNIILASALILGLGFSATAQQHNMRPMHNANGMQHNNMKQQEPKDPRDIALNKTVAMNKQIGLTPKQSRKVYRMELREAKQTIKLQDIKRENRQELKDVLTKEQMGGLKKQTPKKNGNMRNVKQAHSQTTVIRMQATNANKGMKMQKNDNKKDGSRACCNKH